MESAPPGKRDAARLFTQGISIYYEITVNYVDIFLLPLPFSRCMMRSFPLPCFLCRLCGFFLQRRIITQKKGRTSGIIPDVKEAGFSYVNIKIFHQLDIRKGLILWLIYFYPVTTTVTSFWAAMAMIHSTAAAAPTC